MFCPKCNTYIPDDKLYCPKCGEEIIIVSDFDIKLEDNIDTTVFAQTTELPDLSKDNSDEADDTIEILNIDDKKDAPVKIPKIFWIIGAVVCVVLVVLTAVIVNAVRDYTSYDIQYDKAKAYYDEGEFSSAVKTVKHAIALDEEEVRGYVLLADIYSSQSKYDAAIAVLIDILEENPGLISLYDRIISCYEAIGDYDSIRSLLELTDDERVRSKYISYFPVPPAFSIQSGDYIAPVVVTLSADDEGQIYYTLDGSEPTKESLVYSDGIPLDEGETRISAIFINSKGLKSEIVFNTYTVKSDIPDAPKVITASGSYNVPNPIGVDTVEGLKYYYTLGDETPTEDDSLYEMPIFMPFGKSQFTFIAQSESGQYSPSVTVQYDLSFAATIDKQVAEYAVSYHLLTIGDTTIGYTYSSTRGYTKDSVSYYIVDEMNGTKKTGRLFAVDASSGALYKVVSDAEQREYIFKPM